MDKKYCGSCDQGTTELQSHDASSIKRILLFGGLFYLSCFFFSELAVIVVLQTKKPRRDRIGERRKSTRDGGRRMRFVTTSAA